MRDSDVLVANPSLGEHGRVSLIRQQGIAVPLRGGTRLEAGDEVLAFATPDLDVGALLRVTGEAEEEQR